MTTPTKPEWLIPGYPALKSDDTVGQAAVEGQIYEYPQVVRANSDPPIPGQLYQNLSFMLFKEPKTTEAGKKVFGFLKVRGAFPDKTAAEFAAGKIIREIDSKFEIKIAPCGTWVPITDSDERTREKIDVKTTDDEVCLRDQAAKEKEADSRRLQREIREREEECKNDGDIYDDQESLRYYSMRRVTFEKLYEEVALQENRIQTIRDALTKVTRELHNLDVGHTDYRAVWTDPYNAERAKGGLPPYIPSEDQEDAYDQAVKSLESDSSVAASSS